MKVILQDNKIIVFLNSQEKINFEDKEQLNKYFKKLFIKLKKRYDLEFVGYYNIDIYKNKFGIILEIIDEEIDYYNYFNQVDMKINVYKNSDFLYQINYNFLDNDIIKNTICYKNSDNIYLKVKKDINDMSLLKLREYSKIIYGDKVKEILNKSKKVNL